MSRESYGKHTFRYVRDPESRGKVKVYVERGVNSRTQHIYKGKNGSPPYICIKPEHKPSSLSGARKLAHTWSRKHGG